MTKFESGLRVAVASCTLATLMACASGPAAIGPVPPNVTADRYGALQFYAARSMNCPQDQVTYATFGSGRHMFSGCGQKTEMLLLEGTDAGAYGWGRGFATPAPTTRYAKELGCELEKTKDERVDFRTRIVDGCGKRVTYVNVCTFNCSWVANVEANSK